MHLRIVRQPPSVAWGFACLREHINFDPIFQDIGIVPLATDQGHKLVVGADTGEIRACLSHNGSTVRRLDPHNGPVNWLSFASRKTDK